MTKTMMQNQPKWCTCIWSWSVWTQPARPGVCHRQREGPVMLQIPVKFVLPQEWNLPLHTIINFDVDQWILDTYSNKKWRQIAKLARGRTFSHLVMDYPSKCPAPSRRPGLELTAPNALTTGAITTGEVTTLLLSGPKKAIWIVYLLWLSREWGEWDSNIVVDWITHPFPKHQQGTSI